jgi:ribosomal protein S18 acetylase RimI-like enzyme
LQDLKKLDNPVWHSLNETHAGFAITYNNLLCYRPDVCPFGGYIGGNNIANGIDEYAKLGGDFFVVGEKPLFSTNVQLQFELVCVQMVIDHFIDLTITEDIVPLKNGHEDDLYKLVHMVMPDYYKVNTHLTGDYYGIFKDGILVAAAGERMKMDGFTEVSAVVTHPNYTGKDYAKQLSAYLSNSIFNQGKTPFLHTGETNPISIPLYQKLGFTIRRKISFWNFIAK